MNFITPHLYPRLKPFWLYCLSLGLMALAPSSLSAASEEDLQFTLINNDTEYSVSAKDPNTLSGAVVVPSSYEGKAITSIAPNAFYGSTELTYVDLSETSITTIGSGAFSGCRKLTSVIFPNTINSIHSGAFWNCSSLRSIDLSQTAMTSIGSEAFYFCAALTSVDLSQTTMTSIGEYAFYRCYKLTAIDFPNTLTSIRNYAFQGCAALTSVVLPEALNSIGNRAFAYCKQLASIRLLGPAPTLGTDVFDGTGSDAGGLTLSIKKKYEASYASWGDSYTFDFGDDTTTGPVVLVLKTHYDPSNQAFSIISKGEDISIALHLQHLSSLGAAWDTLNTSTYEKVIDANSDTVTRTLTINPTTHPTGFYRLVSE